MLFYVQDSDRPMYVVATDFQAAISVWRQVIGQENPDDDCSQDNPDGVNLIAEDRDCFYQKPVEVNGLLLHACKLVHLNLSKMNLPRREQFDFFQRIALDVLAAAIAKTEDRVNGS